MITLLALACNSILATATESCEMQRPHCLSVVQQSRSVISADLDGAARRHEDELRAHEAEEKKRRAGNLKHAGNIAKKLTTMVCRREIPASPTDRFGAVFNRSALAISTERTGIELRPLSVQSLLLFFDF